ncbi:penicillin-binding transpeptidase domain-containing protein [Planomonospora parontospora]|uniref:penicillin-binding transpeptidase domain-containing protein n=1 Tax=Planomonospora parontospora TaxID=58119 RepID=UPI00166F8821|nr:penicillin-binding transpeptidase domain-containing protein [Planomonospora parontospora]GGL14958.1 penicillin-binding protein [Planomonospora parontospora subsp. antibiotica]GII15885.1 penicillin-binding protein [Planomonospora parontospora subsp. antibiotica]
MDAIRDRRFLALIAVAIAITLFGLYALVAGADTGDGGGAAERSRPGPARPRVMELSPVPDAEPAPSAVLTPGPSALPPTPAPVPPTPAPPTPAPAPPDGPGPVAARYFDAWRAGDLAAMAGLVAGPPSDFAERHRRFSADLRVTSVSLTPGTPSGGGDTAEVPFTGAREVAGLGRWEFSSVLRLARRDGSWKVLWSPETLHPALGGGGTLRRRETPVPRPATLTREGLPFPRDSRAGDHYTGLDGTAVDVELVEKPSGRVLLAARAPEVPGTRTTISQAVQAAAARALDGVGQPAAIVAVDVPTGQVRAVADTLGARGAFAGLYPPGSTFKAVTAAALLRTGLTPDSPVPCPATYTIPNGRSFDNDGGADHGTVPLATAFALSCNTTFAQQARERLRGGGLRAEAADRFGFREKPGASTCRIQEAATADDLGADAIGQHSVLASPLCMAEVAAAVASGTWRPAITTEQPPADAPAPVPLDEGVAAGLRAMMSAAVTRGTAAQAGLPPDTAGKTGTAEVTGMRSHAWFIGYRGDLAFAVLVRNGGSGAAVAAPIAARFLHAL